MTRRVHAVVHDPDGPWIRRWLPTLVGWLFVVVGVVLVRATHLFGFLATAGAAFVFGGPVLLGRQPPAEGEIGLFPGGIELPRRRILTHEVTGASAAARAGGGYTLALALGKRASPVQIEVETLDDVKAIRDALGIGHGGCGEVTFWTEPAPLDEALAILGGLVGFGFAVTSFARLFLGASSSLSTLLMALSFLGVILYGFLWLGRRGSVVPSVKITAGGLVVTTALRKTITLPYAAIVNLLGSRELLVLGGPKPDQMLSVKTPKVTRTRHGLTLAEGELLRAQIASAIARTRGEGPARVDATERVALLERRGEPPRAWLARVEAAASTTATSGYRGGLLSEEDLWSVAEDHDADADARAAAMRVLTRVAPAEARPRVEAIVASVHDEAEKKRIRIALEPDVETAAAELEALERDAQKAR